MSSEAFENIFTEITQGLQTTKRKSNYALMKIAWLNEQSSPELLPYETSLVKSFKNEIIELEEKIEDSQMEKITESQRFVNNILLISLERSKYILTSYLRSRMRKLEKFFSFYLSDQTHRNKLAPEELDYIQKYKGLIDNLFQTTLLDQLPAEYQKVDPTMVVRPNLNTHVICRVLEDIGELEIESGTGTTVEFVENDLLAIRYNVIRQLLLDKRVELI